MAPYNHQLLQTEHVIKLLSTILTKHLTDLGQMWPKYLLLATLAYNTFGTPNLANYSPYELILVENQIYSNSEKPILILRYQEHLKTTIHY